MLYIKRMLSIAGFGAGLVVLLLAASLLLIPKDNTAAAGMEEVAANGVRGEAAESIEVLILGDSESYSAISPLHIWKDTGYTAYVCGTPSQRLPYTNTMLQRAFEKQKPRLVILETLAIYRPISLGNVGMVELSHYFPVFQYHNRWKSLNSLDFGTVGEFSWTDEYKGFRCNTKTEAGGDSDHMHADSDVRPVAKTNRVYMQAIKEFCDQHNAELVLLSTPSTVNWDQRSHNGIAALAKELDCRYIDLNLIEDELGIDWRQDTRDKGDHLNYNGAVKVSAYLAKYLTEKGIFTDHRQDKTYEKWNENLQKLETEAAQ